MEFGQFRPEDMGEKPPIDRMTQFLIDRYFREKAEEEPEEPIDRDEQIRRWLGFMGQ